MDDRLRSLEQEAQADPKNGLAQQALAREARRQGIDRLFPRSWQEDGFWDEKSGEWLEEEGTLRCPGTKSHKEFHFIQSAEQFGDIDLQVSIHYLVDRQPDDPYWAFARGFALIYHCDSDNSIEFRFFPDAQQFSLYLHDQNTEAEVIKMGPPLPPKRSALFHFTLKSGQITGRVNGQDIFSEQTSLRQGALRLTAHNNECVFQLQEFFANAPLTEETREASTELPLKRRYGRVTLSHFQLEAGSQRGNEIDVEAGEQVKVSTEFLYEGPEDGTTNQIILGIPEFGALVCLYNGFSRGQGELQSEFRAPLEPGHYELRFRYAQANNPEDALNWWSVDGEPGPRATIARLHVRESLNEEHP